MVAPSSKQRAGDRASVVAGVGSNDTAPRRPDGRPRRGGRRRRPPAGLRRTTTSRTQAGLVAHCRAVADATDLPVMLYDIPGAHRHPVHHRDAASRSPSTRSIVAVKDAKGDLWASTQVMAADRPALVQRRRRRSTSPHLAQGATGIVSRRRPRRRRAVCRDGRRRRPRRPRARPSRSTTALIPVVDAIMTTSQGAIMAKAALRRARGHRVGGRAAAAGRVTAGAPRAAARRLSRRSGTPMSHPHPELDLPGPARRRRRARRRARRPRRGRPQHDRHRARAASCSSSTAACSSPRTTTPAST